MAVLIHNHLVGHIKALNSQGSGIFLEGFRNQIKLVRILIIAAATVFSWWKLLIQCHFDTSVFQLLSLSLSHTDLQPLTVLS